VEETLVRDKVLYLRPAPVRHADWVPRPQSPSPKSLSSFHRRK
jgi:hypothetical protein